jgi:hypothetical protein
VRAPRPALSPAAAALPSARSLNFGDDAGDMVVGWATTDTSADTLVEWGTKSGAYTHSARGTSETYTYSASYTSPLLHHATMTNLAAKTQYFYRVGTNDSWSGEYSFVSNAVGADQFPYTLGAFADLGESNNAVSTVTHLLSSKADSLLLIGDMSYASGCEKNGCSASRVRALATPACTVPHVRPRPHRRRPLSRALLSLRSDVGRLPAHARAAERDRADARRTRQPRVSNALVVAAALDPPRLTLTCPAPPGTTT